jgi:antitoxin ParD1/3/4
MAQRLTTMNVSMPKEMREFVRTRMKEGGFANTSEYMRHLIRMDENQLDEETLRVLIKRSLEGGPSITMDRERWRQFSDQLAHKHRGKKSA